MCSSISGRVLEALIAKERILAIAKCKHRKYNIERIDSMSRRTSNENNRRIGKTQLKVNYTFLERC